MTNASKIFSKSKHEPICFFLNKNNIHTIHYLATYDTVGEHLDLHIYKSKYR